MSITEILVIVFGLYVGYWVVSKLFTDKPNVENQAHPGPEQETKREASQNNDSTLPAWYVVLNVTPYATVDEIRRAYKVLMSQYHPDKVDSLGDELKALAERKSKEITSAYREAMQLRGGDV